jgi:hypothetical protein
VETAAVVQLALTALSVAALIYVASVVRAMRAELRAARSGSARIAAREHEVTRTKIRETVREEARALQAGVGLAHGSLELVSAQVRSLYVRLSRAETERAPAPPVGRVDLLSESTPAIETPPPSSRRAARPARTA